MHNQTAWDLEADRKGPWSQPVATETVAFARRGDWKVHLTPSPLATDWLGKVAGKEILCLASAGGQQAPVLAAAGAKVTVFDLSSKQLAKDAEVAVRDGLTLKIVQGDMRDLSIFSDGSFDLILHPISNQYVPDIQSVWNESYRVLRKGGVLLASFFNPVLFVAARSLADVSDDCIRLRYKVPYSDIADLNTEELTNKRERSAPLIFGHDLQTQIGGQILAGFVIDGFFEEYHPTPRFALERYVPSFIATRALKH